MRVRRIGIWALGLWLALVGVGLAQTTGTIEGLVTDESGGVLPGAVVDATSTATGAVHPTTADERGHFAVAVPAGHYRVQVALTGFRSLVRDDVIVRVESVTRLDTVMPLAGLTDTVSVVVAETPVITRGGTVGAVITQEQIVELPLNGRNFTQLGTLIPGVLAPPGGTNGSNGLGGSAGDATPGGFGAVTSGFAVNGQRNQSNNFLLDGASNNDTFNTGFVLRPPPDAIQEFTILTHSYGAEYGRNAGSVVNVVTRSGSNTVHGAGWEFFRDDALQARNYFAPASQTKPALRQHQFGGSGGGPVVRDRLFGFGYVEGFRNATGVTQNIPVLSDAQRRGEFGTAVIRDPQTGLPFPGNAIPSARLDPSAVALLSEFVPRANVGSGRYVTSPTAVDRRAQFGVRFDLQRAPGHTLLGRYLQSRTTRRDPPTTRPIGTVATATLQDVMVADTRAIGATAFATTRVSYNRIDARPNSTSGLANSAYGIDVPQNRPDAAGLANIGIDGYFSLGDLAQPFIRRRNGVLQVSMDLAWAAGRHAVKVGVDTRREHMVVAFVNRPNGDFTFNGYATGNAAADFLLGLPGQFRRATTNTDQDGVGWLSSAYVQDEVRVSRAVTLNLGLRYELPMPFVDARDAMNAFRPGQQSTRFPDAPTGLVYPGDAGVPRGTYATDRNNLAPRASGVWDLTGNGRSVVRGAWGLFYDALAGQGDFFQSGVLAPPFTPLLELNAPASALSLAHPVSGAAATARAFPPGLIFIGWGRDFTTPWTQHVSASWQQVTGPWTTELGYVGSRGHHLPIFMEVNPGVYLPGQTTPGARVMPAFSLVRPTFSSARSWYDALQATTRLRQIHGVTVLTSYTWSRALDHVSGLNIGGEPRPVMPVTIGDQASVERALAYEKGPALFDARHRLVASATAEIPAPRVSRPVLRTLLGGWRVSGIVQMQSGFPFTVYDSVSSIRYLTNRPDQVCDPNRGPRSTTQWFETACFVRRPVAATAAPGSTPRNSVRGPGLSRTDLAIVKSVGMGSGRRVEWRLEVFNAWNQALFRQPGNIIGSPTFGQITSADDGRTLQLAVKYVF